MNLKDIASGAWHVLKTVAPTIADTAAGPFAPLVDPIMRVIFGSSDPKAVEMGLLNATPDQLLALKNAENAHIEKLAQLGIDTTKLVLDDLANARAMEVSTRDPTVARLAWLVIGGFMVMSAGVIVGLFLAPAQAKMLLTGEAGLFFGTIFGYLANEAKQAAAFYFGSTLASQAKDTTIAEIAKQ